MKPSVWRVLAIASASLIATGVVVTSAPTAQAAQALPPVQIGRVIKLSPHSTVNDHAALPASGPYRIKLAPGTYTWKLHIPNRPYQTTIRLTAPAGTWYSWRCYLHGLGASYPDVNYKSNCILNPDAPGYPTFSLPSVDGTYIKSALSGDSSWTSTLVPQF
ncbi:hypothetical protein [Nonomuraea sp. LPB2021202275-12-8]|uniref:hypothetical protein n=1 Tax=Nonomuraea sp. LPB2021202275-12-8 TaxID=3120159 RepID=UPI00300D0472